MRRQVGFLIVLYIANFGAVQAKCPDKLAKVTTGETTLAQWSVNYDEIHRLKLPDGTAFGVQIGPASTEQTAKWRRATKDDRAELLKIRILDLRDAKQVVVTTNYGPANSHHAFGIDGGANKVRMLGRPGIVLSLAKKPCQ